EIAIALVGLAALALGHPGGNPDLVGDAGTIDSLQHQVEVEGELELADDDDGRIGGAEAEQIAGADLALDLIAGRFEESLDRLIERGFHGPSAWLSSGCADAAPGPPSRWPPWSAGRARACRAVIRGSAALPARDAGRPTPPPPP